MIALLTLLWHPAAATNIVDCRTGVGVSVASTTRHDVQGGVQASFRANDTMMVRLTAPYTGVAYVSPGWGAIADVLWRSGPELKEGGNQLFLRYGGGLLVGRGAYGIETLVVAQGIAGTEVHFGKSPFAWELELRPQLIMAPYAAMDLAVASGVSLWF